MPSQKSKNKRATLHDVAREASVSPMTVSNFVNGKLHFMSEKTRARVGEAIAELNYRPQTAGRNLRYTKSFSVGMIIVDDSPRYLSDGYTTQVVSGLGNSLNEHGYTLQIEGVTRETFESSSLLRFSRTDGICIMLSGDDDARDSMLEMAHLADQPMVVFLETVDKKFGDVCSVTQQDRLGGTMLAQHVLQRGARKLMLCRHGLNHWKPIEERCAGISQTAAQCDDEVALIIVDCGDGSFAAAQEAIGAAIKSNGTPDAIMAMSDQIGIAALKLIRANGMNAPHDILITGFNAFDFWQYSELNLTTIRSPGYELGAAAGHAMVSRIEKGAFDKRNIELPVELIPGETT